jgi:quercetin dioxygenase-like cupin family protein
MIETLYSYHTGDTTKIERVVEDSGVRINVLTLAVGAAADPHPTPDDAHMIVSKGTLSVALGDQESVTYSEGSIIKIPAHTMMKLANGGSTVLRVFVIKQQ